MLRRMAIVVALELARAITPALADTPQKRIALLIQNDLYPAAEPAKIVDNDASTLAAVLKQDGFEVDLEINASRRDMRSSLDAFVARVTPKTVALVYFKGIGIEVSRLTYLIPVDGSIWSEDDVRRQGTSLDRVMSDLDRRGAGVKIAIVDAARPNPFERRFRAYSAGLSPPSSPEGSLVIFAEALNRVAEPGPGPVSAFMTALVKQVKVANDAEDAFTRTREGVSKASNGRALPWVSSTLVAPFYFAPRLAPQISAAGEGKPSAPAPSAHPTASTPLPAKPPSPPSAPPPPSAAPTVAANPPKPGTPPTAPSSATPPGVTAQAPSVHPIAPTPSPAKPHSPPSAPPPPSAAPTVAANPPKPSTPPTAPSSATPPAVIAQAPSAHPIAPTPSPAKPPTALPPPSAPSPQNAPPAIAVNPPKPSLPPAVAAAGTNDPGKPPKAPSPPSAVAGIMPGDGAATPAAPKPRPADQTPAATPRPGSTFSDCRRCPEMTVLAPAAFRMGSGATPFDRPVHEVKIAKPFAIGRSVVTQGEWKLCVDEGGCTAHHDAKADDDRPMVEVSWFDAERYIGWLSKKTGKTYRLPSEAEWEYAARGGTTTAFAWGDAPGIGHANCDDCGNTNGPPEAQPVRSYPANSFGLYDMAGNVAEWLQDCWTLTYRGAPRDGSAAPGDSCKLRVVRGGSFETSSAYIKPTARYRSEPETTSRSTGFRVARDVD